MMSKKILMMTASLLAFQGDVHGFSSKPDLMISGETTATFLTLDQPAGVRQGKGLGHGFLFNGHIDFKAQGQAQDVYYQAVIGLTADSNPGDVGQKSSVQKSYIELKTPQQGTLQIGNASSLPSKLGRGVSKVLGGSKGWNGTFYDVIAKPSGTVIPDRLSSDPGFATGVSWVSPERKGFKVGLGFVPNTTHRGLDKLRDNQNFNGNKSAIYENSQEAFQKRNKNDCRDPSEGSYDLNSVSLGMSYDYAHSDDFEASCSIVGLSGRSKPRHYEETLQINHTRAYQIGLDLSFKNIDFGATYTNNLQSRIAKNSNNGWSDGKYDAGQVSSMAVAYNYGPFKISGGFSHGQKQFGVQKTFSNVRTVALDYVMIPGWKMSAEYDYATLKTCSRALEIAKSTFDQSEVQNNRPRTLMISTSISF